MADMGRFHLPVGNLRAGPPLMRHPTASTPQERAMRYVLLWLLGIPIPVLLLIWLFWS